MGKKCEKCLQKYDDTWGTCLLCGDKLKREEECRSVCEAEGSEPGEVLAEKSFLKGLAYLLGMIIFAGGIFYLIYFLGMDIWSKVIENILATAGK